jgi:hypothetical protein
MSVTASEILCKQPGEKRQYSMDFSNLMTSIETISSIDETTQTFRNRATSTDLTITSSAISGQTVTMWIEEGTHRRTYIVQVTITTSGGQILVGDGLITVTER